MEQNNNKIMNNMYVSFNDLIDVMEKSYSNTIGELSKYFKFGISQAVHMELMLLIGVKTKEDLENITDEKIIEKLREIRMILNER